MEQPTLPGIDDTPTARRLSPTDISQFIRLDQCERYLRLRLHERSAGGRFMRDYGVVPQSIPPLLTRSGESFEQHVEAAIGGRYPAVDLSTGVERASNREEDNARVVALAGGLAPGATVVAFQPRLDVQLDEWRIRGDVDVVRLERSADDKLSVLIADMKSSTSAKVEHRLQVAFYRAMLAALFNEAGIAYDRIGIGILYRGPAGETSGMNAEEARKQEQQRADCERLFGTRDGLIELVPDPENYDAAVADLVTSSTSTAQRVSTTTFEAIPYHLTYKCDGCLYNEFCMKWSAEHDDLSLLPHLTDHEKQAFRRSGLTTTGELALLKELDTDTRELTPVPGKETLTRKLAATWPIGPHLDELVHRARRYRDFKGDKIGSLSYIPSKGYGSLPYCDADHNPNLVRIYVDAQHDYLNDRIYMLGALVVACENGIEVPSRRRSVVRLAEEPARTADVEEQLFLRWIDETLRAVVELAAPDAEGKPRVPIHLIFWNSFEQRLLLDGLARHFGAIFAATPLYDFLTQIAAFDSPLVTYLDQEIRELKNYPMVCQSLQAVAAFLRFDWNTPERYRDIFRTRLFDFWGKLEQDMPELSPWYTSRARFNSQIPLEYAYAAWGDLNPPREDRHDEFASYRVATPELLIGFHGRRLEALERITHDFKGNKQTEKSLFDLPDLVNYQGKARTLAQALDEFVTIERHVELSTWKSLRLMPPERRVLAGETLIVRYDEADQEPGVAALNRENERNRTLSDQYRAAYFASHPDAKRFQSTKEQREQSKWSQEGLRLRLRLETRGIDAGLDEVLALSTLRVGERVIVMPRTTVDERLAPAEQTPFTPTPKQMLYGTRAEIREIVVERDAAGRAVTASVEIEFQAGRGGAWSRGFVFGSIDRPLLDGQRYTLDPDPNSWMGYYGAKIVEGLVGIETGTQGGRNTLYDRLAHPSTMPSPRSLGEHGITGSGQSRFLAGLDALYAERALHDFEASKRAYIGEHADTPTLLVQGPPGTGKSYSTAFALFARIQGAMADGRPFRVFVSCKTHAATDVLLQNIHTVRDLLRRLWHEHSAICSHFFDARLLDVPLFRVNPKEASPEDVIALHKKEERRDGEPRTADAIMAERWCVVAATPAAINGMVKEQWDKDVFGHELADCLVLDEASQMNLPEAAMAALPLAAHGQLIVVGDHRQMPPIIKHDWSNEPRRTFQEYRSYESLFLTLLALEPSMIKFEESFRLHADMAEFLRREVYAQDGIHYHSQRRDLLLDLSHPDFFVHSVLAPEQTIVVVVHDEDGSQLSNPFEQALITPILQALADPAGYGLDPQDGLGVVVPHRAQRAALQSALPPMLSRRDPETDRVVLSAVDTVERFQGGERTAIMVSATESDRGYLLASGQFLLDPRRLTVALSRAKRKMVLVAARSVFEMFSADEETFANSQLWKNLLRRTCTIKLWEGEREGKHVEVWGNHPVA